MRRHLHAFRRLLLLITCLSLVTAAWSQSSPTPSEPPPREDTPDTRLRLDWKRDAESLRVMTLQGQDITGEAQPRQEADQVSLAVSRHQPFVVKDERVETLTLRSEERLVLPGGLVVPDVAQTDETGKSVTGEGGALIASWIRLTLAPSPIPAIWHEETRAYHTDLSFGLRSPDSRRNAAPLSHPVTVRMGFSGLEALEAVPALTLEATGLAHEKTVSLRFLPRTPTPIVRVRSTLSDVDLEIEALPRLTVRPASSSLMGLGLAAQEVTIVQLAPHGVPLPAESPTDIDVTLHGGGHLESGRLQLAPDASAASFSLRSRGLAPITVTAFAGGMRGSATIEQHFPWGPVIAALGGGALGGFARRFVKGARKRQAPRRLIEGVVVASIAYVAGVLGVGYLALPTAVVASEAGAFLTGALTGFLGVTVLEALSRQRARPTG
ncbi:hypothetical protein [Halomonas cerina]|uniref:Transmembrane protein n=1 Tax=Halomonas cerina TaxID=447424 RepID=A0A839VGA9_9GAMM|nr:hypothetical protein [Halomonas cerina]MBB3192369.1 hypothetical protein [Halomonas cerina]